MTRPVPSPLAAIPTVEHERWMRVALGLAERGAGNSWPNPNVGCVLLREGRVVGRGWTQPGGRPHAEAMALAQAGPAAAGAIAYVTLEPCAHHGRTPPCAEALIAAGVAGCVIATGDPDPRVDGGGIAILEAAGVEVLHGVCEAEARWTARGFLTRVTRARPWVTCKLATSLDGRIAAADGRSQWITGPEARAHGHMLRAGHDVILVGMGTVRSDDPLLTCRIPGLERRSPVRAVVASGRNFPLDRKLFAASAHDRENESLPPVWLLHGRDLPAAAAAELDRRGVVRLPVSGRGNAEMVDAGMVDAGMVDAGSDRPEPAALLAALAQAGATRVLVEGGAGMATAFLSAGLVDALAWYRAGRLLGGEGLAAFGRLPPVDLLEAPDWQRREVQALGVDVLETFVRAG